MAKTDVTINQGLELVRLANSKGVPRWRLQEAIDRGDFAAFIGGLLAPKAHSANAILLEFLRSVTVPASKKKFVAREKFVVDMRSTTRVKISLVGGDFKKWFLSGEGKIEEERGSCELDYFRVRKSSSLVALVNYLGDKEKVESTLSTIFHLMEQSPREDEQGALLRDGHTNIFCVRDCSGVLRAIELNWDKWSGGWQMVACDIEEDLFERQSGFRVFAPTY